MLYVHICISLIKEQDSPSVRRTLTFTCALIKSTNSLSTCVAIGVVAVVVNVYANFNLNLKPFAHIQQQQRLMEARTKRSRINLLNSRIAYTPHAPQLKSEHSIPVNNLPSTPVSLLSHAVLLMSACWTLKAPNQHQSALLTIPTTQAAECFPISRLL